VLTIGCCSLPTASLHAQSRDEEIEQLQKTMAEMQKTIEQLRGRVTTLEREKARAPATTPAPRNSAPPFPGHFPTVNPATTNAIPAGTAQERDRNTFLDLQTSAPRPNNEPLGPLKGFIPIPGTDTIVKLGGNVRLDMILDGKNNGNPNEFIPSSFPVDSSHGHIRSQVQASASRLSLEVRRPVPDGTLRIYYENDFFGDSASSTMTYRLRQLYGQAWNFLVGQTYSTFMDVDAVPDTVDAQGPNAFVNKRLPQIRYTIPFTEHLDLAFGIEQPGADLDLSSDLYGPNAHAYSRIPDLASNLRWEQKDLGHVQLSGIVRSLAFESDSGRQTATGWGLSLSGGVDVFQDDHFSAQVTYGRGIEKYILDSGGLGQDAALDEHNRLHPLDLFGAVVGYTHQWAPQWKSTVAYGYLHTQTEPVLGDDAFAGSQYGSLNVIWQPTTSFRMGLEYLYGEKRTRASGSQWGQRLDFVIRYDLVR